jgi:hypothetical protein
MTNIMTIGGIELSSPLQWTDEFSATHISQTTKMTLSGDEVSYQVPLNSGINITLESTSDSGWMQRSTLAAIYALSLTGQSINIVLRGVVYDVLFRYQDKAIEASPLFNSSDNPAATDYYMVKLRFITV